MIYLLLVSFHSDQILFYYYRSPIKTLDAVSSGVLANRPVDGASFFIGLESENAEVCAELRGAWADAIKHRKAIAEALVCDMRSALIFTVSVILTQHE